MGQDETRNSETNSVRIYAMSRTSYYSLGEIIVARCEQRDTPNVEMIVQSEGVRDSVRSKERRRGPPLQFGAHRGDLHRHTYVNYQTSNKTEMRNVHCSSSKLALQICAISKQKKK